MGADVGPFGYVMSQEVANLVIAFLVGLPARPALRRTDGWALTVARASVVLALLALAGVLLVLAGGVVTGGIVTF